MCCSGAGWNEAWAGPTVLGARQGRVSESPPPVKKVPPVPHRECRYFLREAACDSWPAGPETGPEEPKELVSRE